MRTTCRTHGELIVDLNGVSFCRKCRTERRDEILQLFGRPLTTVFIPEHDRQPDEVNQ